MEVGVAGVCVVRAPPLSTQEQDLNHAGYRGNPGTVCVCVRVLGGGGLSFPFLLQASLCPCVKQKG